MYEIRLCSKYGSPKKRIGKLVVTHQWQECDKFIALKAAPFEGSVFDIRAATGKGRKVTAPEPPKIVIQVVEEAAKAPAPDPPAVDPRTGFIKMEPVPGEGEDKNVLIDEKGEVVDEAIMLVPDEPKEEPEETEGVEVVVKEAPVSDDPETAPKLDEPKKGSGKAKKKGGKSGKKKR